MNRLVTTLVAISIIAAYPISVAAAEYRAVILPALNGYSRSQALGINDSGQIVGYSYSTGPSDYEACVWQNGEVTSLGKPFGMTASMATCINNKGEIAGESYDAVDSRACIWAGDSVVDISVGGLFRTVCGINDNGWVVGAADVPVTHVNQSCVYKDGALTYIPSYWAPSRAINNNGQVVGDGNGVGSGVYDAFIWENGVMRALGILPGCNASVAQSINGSGQIVGGSCVAGGMTAYATVWQNGSMAKLSSLNGYSYGWANSINNSGLVAGCSFNLPNRYEACYWREGNPIGLGPGVPLSINSGGQIVGYTYSQTGAEQAVLWQPVPEPASLSVLVAGLGCVIGGSRQRKMRVSGERAASSRRAEFDETGMAANNSSHKKPSESVGP